MLLFLLFLFPLALVCNCFYQKNPKHLFVIVLGVLTGSIVCAFNFFFKFTHRVVPYSFGLNFLYYTEKLGLIPVVVLSAVYCLISKDKIDDKVDFYLPLMLSFYAILVPYNVIAITESSIYSGFDLFLKPIIYLAMVFNSAFLLNRIYEAFLAKKIPYFVIAIIVLVLQLLTPAIIEALYIIKKPFIIVLLLSFATIVFPIIRIVKEIVLNGVSKEE